MNRLHSLLVTSVLLLVANCCLAKQIACYNFNGRDKELPDNMYMPNPEFGEVGQPLLIHAPDLGDGTHAVTFGKDQERDVLILSRSHKYGTTNFVFVAKEPEIAVTAEVLTLEMVFSLQEVRGVTTGGKQNFMRLIATEELFVNVFDSDTEAGTFSMEIAANRVSTTIKGLPLKSYLHFALTVDTDGTMLAYINGQPRAETMKKPGKLHTTLFLGSWLPGERSFLGVLRVNIDDLILHNELLQPSDFSGRSSRK